MTKIFILYAKIMINCSHVPARWVWGRANSRRMLLNGAIWSVILSSESSRNIQLLHKK